MMTKRAPLATLRCLAILWLASGTLGLKHHAHGWAAAASLKRKLTGASSPQSARYQPPYNVCLYHGMPLVACSDLEPAKYTGYSVALWKLIAQDLGWSDNQWMFTCMESEDLVLADLADPAGNCTMDAAGLKITWDNTRSNAFTFTMPIYKSGSLVLTAAPNKNTDILFFVAPFHYIVWILLGVTIVVTALLVTLGEVLGVGSKANRQGLQGWLWYSLGKQLHFVSMVGAPKTWSNRILVIGYGLVALVSLHLYTAILTTQIIDDRIANQIDSKSDLVGKKVGAWAGGVPSLWKYSVQADPFPWDDESHIGDIIDMLRQDTYKALILDVPTAIYHAATARSCDLFPVGDAFNTYYLSIGFPATVPAALKLSISASIVRLQSKGVLDQLEYEYVYGGNHSCPLPTSGQASSVVNNKITFRQVQGLWIILGGTIGICSLWVGLQCLRNSTWGRKHLSFSHKVQCAPHDTGLHTKNADTRHVEATCETPGAACDDDLVTAVVTGHPKNRAQDKVEEVTNGQYEDKLHWESLTGQYLPGASESLSGVLKLPTSRFAKGEADGASYVRKRSSLQKKTRESESGGSEQPAVGMVVPAALNQVNADSSLEGAS